MKESDKDLELAEKVISELGGISKVARICGMKYASAVGQWKSRGIPRSWELYLKNKFPELEAWQNT